jgi:very-short-patch-repair endonuclease
MSTPQERLIGLLEYIEQVEKLKKTAPTKVPGEYFKVAQGEIQGLPGVEFNLIDGGDDVWMRLSRLIEQDPPDPGASLRPWVSLSKSLEKKPELRNEIIARKDRTTEVYLKLSDFPGIKKSFDRYVTDVWEAWTAAERPRRKSIQLYNKLFAIQQQLESEGADAALELVWGMGVATWKQATSAASIDYPLLTQACEIVLDPQSFALEIRPRETDTVLELDCYSDLGVEGVSRLQAYWNKYKEAAASRPTPFDSSSTHEVLKAAASWLDSAGQFVQSPVAKAPPAVAPPPPTSKPTAGPMISNPIPTTRGPRDLAAAVQPALATPPIETVPIAPPADKETLVVTDAWVLFVRKRTGHLFVLDIERLKKTLKNLGDLPSALAAFVTAGSDEVVHREEVNFRGLSSSRTSPGVRELYFPMPYNDEQVSIVSKLETSDGVVVQGPPGTGKTHTIANVICHFLAHGKRVLVTSKGDEALRVLRDQLPEEIRTLSVALLTDDRSGMKQFEHSVQAIATNVANMQPARIEAQIAQHEARLVELHEKIAALDHAITELASRQLAKIKADEGEVSPEELARMVVDQEPLHNWLTDELDPAKARDPSFTNEDISALREARRRVGQDLKYLTCELPATDSLLNGDALLALHKDLQRSRSIDLAVSEGAVWPLIDTTPATFDNAKALFERLARGEALKSQIAANARPWDSTIRSLFSTVSAKNDLASQILGACKLILEAETARRERLAAPVAAPPDCELEADVLEAVDRCCSGRSPFGLPFGKKGARAAIAQMTVSGLRPNSEEAWARVKAELTHRIDARRLVSSWNAMAQEFGIDPVEGIDAAAFRKLVDTTEHIRLIHSLATEVDRFFLASVDAVFGNTIGKALASNIDEAQSQVMANLGTQLDKGRLAYAMRQVEDLRAKLEGKSGDAVAGIRVFIANELGSRDCSDDLLSRRWQELLAELRRLAAFKSDWVTIDRITSHIEGSGAVLWAKRLQSVPAGAEADPELPTNWLEAWRWRTARSLLERMEGHQQLKDRFEKRKTAEADLATTYKSLVAAKTWLAVFRNSPEAVRQALQEYLNEIQAIGAGTGIRAVHHRQLARAAMERAYPAVPCWIMPQWRVSESIPAKVGSFDLVVIDEASQSDIWALPALLRGKKVLVVGDHRQVSPAGVGMEEQKIKDLFNRFLVGLPHGSQMRPDRSIYDLALVVFAGNAIMLKEHFRCVPAIIEFSKREFYEHEIKPLRIPKRSERLDPPLIDVFVKGGFRKGGGDVNEPEAHAIVKEIESIIADPTMTGRTIGVCTLLGQAQGKFIDDLVRRKVPPHEIVKRRIRVGDPPYFQGRESDIMLLSMVLEKKDRGLSNMALFQQRFNVAASRARDRMILFRSIEESDVNPETLTAKLMAHFRKPFHQDAARVGALRTLCESDFEREMFDVLSERGYRVVPQVKVGGYRIDFVVEGVEDRRLALECDGDRYHGPGQWADDMTRQRVLERAGWVFWRCFASSFVLRRRQVLEDLFTTLKKMGIDPIGNNKVEDASAWVATRVIDPLADAEPAEA